jgi:YidC/Oxa1 family membrane protein insertase
MGGELESFDIDSEEKIRPVPMNGQTEWIAIRTKYFLSAIIPTNAQTSGVIFGGEGVNINDIIQRRYNTAIISDLQGQSIKDTYRIYMGPLEYTALSDYENGLTDLIMNHGWYERTFRPISLLILRVFKFFQLFISNYGIVIILFSILVKVVVYPLTKKSYKSMKEMSNVQPLLTELREKYKTDPQRLNKETMKLYKEHGINPLGGCLPMLLQLPLLGALFIVFRSTIQLRGASFIPGWIDDLSSADTIFTLPFSLPLYGDQFNILPILMAVTMIFQSKMTMQDPKQKAMVYIMPIFMLLIFNQFPSGLNLYYTMFNVLTIIQQKFTDGTDKAKKNK